MDLGLEGKVALIAGGSSGIGLATAVELAREGMHVAIGARDEQRLAAAARTIEQAGAGRVLALPVDVTDSTAARRWVEQAASELGALHVVLVSGGSPPIGPASAFEPADYQAAVDKVLHPAVTIALAAVAHLRAAGWGRLLFVGSETAVVPVGPLALSGVTRAALVRFAQGLAADLGAEGITVNVLAPGSVRTPPMERAAARLAGADSAGADSSGADSTGADSTGADSGDVEAQLAAMGHHSAVGRLARPEEIAAVAAFLASERASFVTGGVHLIDGGASVVGPELPHLTGAGRNTYT